MGIVLVGGTMASATGVGKGIKVATASDLSFFGVYVDGANTSINLPSGIARHRTLAWTSEGIAAATKQMTGEGKNAGQPGMRA